MRLAILLSCLLSLTLPGAATAEPPEPAAPPAVSTEAQGKPADVAAVEQAPKAEAKLPLAGTDWPDYEEEAGSLTLAGIDPKTLAAAEPQFRRLSLVDIEEVPYLPKVLTVYQTVSIGVEMPVSLHFVVDSAQRAWCFNPEIPYCQSDFELFNHWLRRAEVKVATQEEAATLARFLVEMGLSTVHHPRDFLFFRLSQKFGVERYQYLRNIEEIYLPEHAPYRSEEEAREYATITERYRDRVKPPVVEANADGWHMHAFTYKMMKGAGDLREWDIQVTPGGQVKVDMKTLEKGIGEVSWSWAS